MKDLYITLVCGFVLGSFCGWVLRDETGKAYLANHGIGGYNAKTAVYELKVTHE